MTARQVGATEMHSLYLSRYFDLIPQSAIIFITDNQSASPDSLTVCYVNRVFLDSIGDTTLIEDEEFEMAPIERHTAGVPDNFMSILQTQCINPSASHFIQWINEVAQKPENVHNLKTRFKGFTVPKDSHASERTPQFVDIEWNAVVMENKFIVLTGRRNGTVQFSSPSLPSEPTLLNNLRRISIDEEDTEDLVPSVCVATSSSSSGSGRGRRTSTTRLSSSTTLSERSRSSNESDDTLDYEGHKWQHTERVQILRYVLILLVYKSYGWRECDGQAFTGEGVEVN